MKKLLSEKMVERIFGLPYDEARGMKDDKGQLLVQHSVACLDCHDPKTMGVRVTRPNGSVVTQTATTDANGVAVVKLRTKKQDSPGLYHVQSTATVGGSLSGQGATSFTLQ